MLRFIFVFFYLLFKPKYIFVFVKVALVAHDNAALLVFRAFKCFWEQHAKPLCQILKSTVFPKQPLLKTTFEGVV